MPDKRRKSVSPVISNLKTVKQSIASGIKTTKHHDALEIPTKSKYATKLEQAKELGKAYVEQLKFAVTNPIPVAVTSKAGQSVIRGSAKIIDNVKRPIYIKSMEVVGGPKIPVGIDRGPSKDVYKNKGEDLISRMQAEKDAIKGTKGIGKLKKAISEISETDRAKLSVWKYPPNDELYLKYKEAFDNPKYYNQETGAINWPKNDGFLNTPIEKTLQPGFRIDRYGFDTGVFVSPEGVPYEMRAVAPGTDLRPYSIFEVVAPLEVKGGEIAPWFDEVGGGIQYVLPETIEDLLESGILRRITP